MGYDEELKKGKRGSILTASSLFVLLSWATCQESLMSRVFADDENKSSEIAQLIVMYCLALDTF